MTLPNEATATLVSPVLLMPIMPSGTSMAQSGPGEAGSTVQSPFPSCPFCREGCGRLGGYKHLDLETQAGVAGSAVVRSKHSSLALTLTSLTRESCSLCWMSWPGSFTVFLARLSASVHVSSMRDGLREGVSAGSVISVERLTCCMLHSVAVRKKATHMK